MRFYCLQHYRLPRLLTKSRNDEKPKRLLLRHCKAKLKQSIMLHI
ncbi:hypothetical protein [Helicobacter sp.]|nr:hypothetical protein [Helicobacter sp.]